jgi:CheY-like chemotaxis protein
MNKCLPRVLILDIDPDSLIALQHVLEGADLDSTITWDEAEACQLLANAAFDLIIIGDHPPELNPATILYHLRSRATSAPVLILRGITGDKDTDNFRRLGAVGVVSKRNPLAVLEQVKQTLASTQFEDNSVNAGVIEAPLERAA